MMLARFNGEGCIGAKVDGSDPHAVQADPSDFPAVAAGGILAYHIDQGFARLNSCRRMTSFAGFDAERDIVRTAGGLGFGDCGFVLVKGKAGKKHDGKKRFHIDLLSRYAELLDERASGERFFKS